MQTFRSLPKLFWPFRKLFLGIPLGALVLDVGSGDSPNPRADILFDRLIGADHRCGNKVVIDRPSVFGDAHGLPFKDKSFDYVIASHVLEHMSDPQLFISELQRVAYAGYIEVPSAIFESISPLHVHCNEILFSDSNKLLIRKKKSPEDCLLLGDFKPFSGAHKEWINMVTKFPHLFHIRLIWRGVIDYKILNPEASYSWIDTDEVPNGDFTSLTSKRYLTSGIRGFGLNFLTFAFKLLKHQRKVHLHSLMMCPSCRVSLIFKKYLSVCPKCQKSWVINS
jgi:SAM-dependent methyltransferase